MRKLKKGLSELTVAFEPGFEVDGEVVCRTFQPSYVVTRDGTLVAFCQGRLRGGSDDDPKMILTSRSEDYGATWSSVKVVSGGEQRRLMFGKLTLQRPNVMIMDEPTNHLDMESIEALNLALENYPGTLIFVSHDRDFVSSLATRIIEMAPGKIINFSGTYDEYLRSQGLIEKSRAA